MAEGEAARLVAWDLELREAHARLRRALTAAREAVVAGAEPSGPAVDPLLYCHGFCVALDGHHRGEDDALFPAMLAADPDLAGVVELLKQDHSMIAHLLGGLREALAAGAPSAELDRHLEGIAAIMESHFGYEERALLPALAALRLDADPSGALGPL